MARRVRLRFAPGVVVEFVDRRRALSQLEAIAERGTRFPLVVYGPGGVGKPRSFVRLSRCSGASGIASSS